MATMTRAPFVNHVPVMTGGVGDSEVRDFYRTYFIPAQPPDTTILPVARTIGTDRLVDELIFRFTHPIEMPWMLLGVPPTGMRVEVAMVGSSSSRMARSQENVSTGTRLPCSHSWD